MSLLLILAATATLTPPLELRADIVRDRFLRVELVARVPDRVLITPRTVLGCYIEVAISDSTGQYLGWFGPRASCATPKPTEFQALETGENSELFGVEIDILAPERVRFRDQGGEVGRLEPNREYRLVVTYHNTDNKSLDAIAK